MCMHVEHALLRVPAAPWCARALVSCGLDVVRIACDLWYIRDVLVLQPGPDCPNGGGSSNLMKICEQHVYNS